MANYNIEKERSEIPFLYCGIVIETTFENTKYLLKSATEYVREKDPYIANFEFPHYVDLGYYFVSNFELLNKDDDKLDLSWMSKDDYIALKGSSQYEQIKSIKVNIDNLSSSYFPRKKSNKKDITLSLNGIYTKMNTAQQIVLYRDFISHNSDCFEGVEFIGFSPVVKDILGAYSKKLGVNVINEEKHKVKSYIR